MLILGTAETVGKSSNLFTQEFSKSRIYRRKEVSIQPDLIEFPAEFSRPQAPSMTSVALPVTPMVDNLATLTDSLLLLQFSPAAVLATPQGDIIYISGKTGKYLEPATGKANLNLFAMARQGLTGALNEAFARCVREQTTAVLKDLNVGDNGDSTLVTVTVQVLTQPPPLNGMLLVVFKDEPTPVPILKALGKRKQSAVHAEQMDVLAAEIQQSREELQTTREEMQTSQEELKSTNEELQSTNEELTTSKEEMQSMNEELQTVNHELTAKVDELSMASDDMKNLLNSTDIATLFLDSQLHVRRFTTEATSIIKLIPGDAGRPITDLVSTLNYPELEDDAREVLRSLIFHEREVSTTGATWYRVRIMPYRTQDNHIDGVVITFVDMSETKAAVLRESTLSQTMTSIATNVPLSDVLTTLVRGVEQEHPGAMGSVLLLDSEGSHIRLGAAPSLFQ